MSIVSTIAAIQTSVASITGVVNTKVGMPNEMELGSYSEDYYPLFVLTGPHGFHWTRAGMGVSGVGFDEYDVRLTFVLGSKNTSADLAIARALPIVDRVRAKFAPDWKLGNTIFNSDIMPTPADNLDTFRELGQPPVVQWVLHVQDERAANATAA